MNKHLPNSLRALFLSLAVLLSLPMLAAQVEIDGINYELNADAKQAAVIAKSSGMYSGEVVIPESVEHEGSAYSVTSIGDDAFRGCSFGLTSVTIPNSVTSIGNCAFYYCSGLTSVTIPNSVTSIGGYAFRGCSGLTSVTIGSGVESIRTFAFYECSGLTSVLISDIAAWCNIDFDGSYSNPLYYANRLYLNGEEVKDLVIPNSVTSIGDGAFSGCFRLTSVTIPNSVTSIGYGAFYGCSGLTSVTIPNSVTSIGTKAFSGCSGLTSVTIGSGMTSIGTEAFSGCSGLTSVTIPNSVTSIGYGAFSRCSALTSVTIGNSVTSIESSAFSRCSGLTSVTIPNSVTSIGKQAFEDCSGLTSVTIGNSVTSIGERAFEDCSGLTSVLISDIAAWCNIKFDGYNSNPLSYVHHLYLNGEEVKDLVIPNSVTSIGDYAFYGCSGLTSVTIPNSVTSIGSYAFYRCSGLTSVTIPNSVTSIGGNAFERCSGLTSVTIGNGVMSIGDYAFQACYGLTSVTIGNSVTSIGKQAFWDCSEHIDIYCYAEKVPSTESNVFPFIGNAILHVPDASIDSYKATAPWNYFGKIVGLSEIEIDGINYELNAEAKQATVIAKSRGKYSGEVVIPESVEHEGSAYSVTSIGGYAFSGCDGLTSVTIPNSVTSIGKQAFAECSGLTSVTIGSGVESIGSGAFEDCSGLTSVLISDIAAWCNIDFDGSYSNPLYYANRLYLNGEEVKDLVIPNSVTSIGDGAFSGCSGLTSVTIPNSVTSIGYEAFYRCSGLTSVTIGNSVTSIGRYAFAGCSGLTSVTIGNSVTSIGDYAFAECTELIDVYCYAEKVPSTESNVFPFIGNAILHVPDASIDSYKATAPWNYFGKIVGLSEIEIEIDGINYELNADAKQATVIAKSRGKYSGEVVIPESVEHEGSAYSVTSIGGYAFSGCDGLTSVTIPNSVTSIGKQAFAECSGLTSVTIPNSVTSIGEAAFSHCSGLTSVTIPNSVTSIGYGAFEDCSGLTSVLISDIAAWCNIDFDGSYSNPLYYANRLYLNGEEVKDLVIPNSVTSIGGYAFSGCSGLTSVTIPNSVTSIGDYAFSFCSELIDVYCYAEKVPSTVSNAFNYSPKENATLHVPDASVDSYKATAPWSSFGKIVGLSGEEPEQPEVEKCATPVVTYAEGKLSFSCETEGAEFVTNVVAEDAKKYNDAEIEFSATYNIEVFATKANCENSDTVNVALVWVENGDVNVETGVISVPAAPVLVQGNGGVLSVSGVAKGTDVVVYTISGTEVARSTATNGTATISTGLQSGTIVVVKFGNKSVKVRI